jgi:glucosylglycerate synthase
LQNDSGSRAPETNSGTNEKNASLTVIPWPVIGAGATDAPVQSISTAYQSVFAASEKLEARACCIVASTLESATSQWTSRLLRPLLEENFDLVAARYSRRTFGGQLNSSIVYPLTRCLYGKRIHNPMGPDLGVSRQLFQKLLGANGNSKSGGGRMHPLASLAPMALCANLKVGPVHVGARVDSPTDWMNISPLMVQILGPIFLDVERNAACWQRTRGSISIPEFDEPLPVLQEAGKVDVDRMVDSFRLGNRDLQEIWRLVLPPATLFELAKLSRLTPDQFRMPDDLWARIIFDFALAHRLQTINRDHLLRSMAPLYLAWVASYARELEIDGAASVEQRIERLSLAYESAKPYFISRWRWPDRFNP